MRHRNDTSSQPRDIDKFGETDGEELTDLEDALFMGSTSEVKFRELNEVRPLPFMTEVRYFFSDVVYSDWFQKLIVGVILFNAVLVGLETNRTYAVQFALGFVILDWIILAIFLCEVLVKWLALIPSFWRYFYSGWNVFDFCIVCASFIQDDEYITILRLVRLLRVLKLLNMIPELQIVTRTLIKSLRSIISIGFLLVLLFYMYAVLGVFTFAKNDPVHFRTLGLSMLSLIRVITLEDWTDLMYINMYGCNKYGYGDHPEKCHAPQGFGNASILYFVSFVLIGTYVILNLFVSAIMANFIEAQKESLASMLEEQDEEEQKKLEEKFRQMTQELKEQIVLLQSMQEEMDDDEYEEEEEEEEPEKSKRSSSRRKTRDVSQDAQLQETLQKMQNFLSPEDEMNTWTARTQLGSKSPRRGSRSPASGKSTPTIVEED